MDEQQLETVSDLMTALLGGEERASKLERGEYVEGMNDDPVYVRTPHGSYHFVVQDVERVVVEGEQRTVIVVREVEWPK